MGMTRLEEMQFLSTFTGEYEFKDDAGVVVAKGFYKDGNKHGLWHHFSDGQIDTETNYVDGVKHGVRKEYGFTYLSDENETPIPYVSRIENFKNGLEDGEVLKYESDGTLYHKATFKNGKRHGLDVQYSTDGSRYCERIYFEDRCISSIAYDKDGNITNKQTYLTNGLRHIETKNNETDVIEVSYNLDNMSTYGQTYKINDATLQIGCKVKTIAEWDEWFAGEEVYQTERGTKKFAQIEANFNIFKEILKSHNVI